MDERELSSATMHLESALAGIDPAADRWVLVDALEGVARLLVLLGRPGARRLVSIAAAIRSEIGQPIPPTDVADVASTLAASSDPDEPAIIPIASALDAHRLAVEALRSVTRTHAS
jgi:hypothetical protein